MIAEFLWTFGGVMQATIVGLFVAMLLMIAGIGIGGAIRKRIRKWRSSAN